MRGGGILGIAFYIGRGMRCIVNVDSLVAPQMKTARIAAGR